MKTGKLATMFSRDGKTITAYTDNEFVRKFFSPAALGTGRPQRDYLDNDIYVMNTVISMKNEGYDWDQIAMRLESGNLNRELPVGAAIVEEKTRVMVYGQIVQLTEQVRKAQDEAAALRLQLESKDEAHRKEIRALMDEAREREGELQRKLGQLEAEIRLTLKP